MTAVKQNLLTMVPDMPRLIPHLTEERANVVYDIFLTVKSETKPAEIPFDPRYTDENRAERMARAFALADEIEIDEQAIKDLREVSMI